MMRHAIILVILLANMAQATLNFYEWNSEPRSLGGNFYTMFGSTPTYAIPQLANTIAYYKFTTGSTLADSSAIGTNVLTDPGGGSSPVFTNNYVSFGGNDYLDATNAVANSFPNPASVTNFTVSFWVKTSNTANNGFAAFSPFNGGHGTFDNSVQSSQFKANIRSPNYSVSSVSNYSDNVWHHVVITVISGEYTNSDLYLINRIALYIDKLAINASPFTGSANTWDFTTPAGSRLILGGYYSTSYCYTGEMDDFIIWSVPLSNGGTITSGYDTATGEIGALYDLGRSSP